MARFTQRRRPSLLLLAAVLVLIALRVFVFQEREDRVQYDNHAGGETHRVERVVDGDTLLLANRQRVRLIGVDTPESVKPDSPVEPFGPEAATFVRVLVEGRDVRLEFDREREDQYGRVLAFVYIGDRLLNEEILREGLGRALLKFPYSGEMKKRFREAEGEAKAARRGIWSQPARKAG